jgi:hypothetical protein
LNDVSLKTPGLIRLKCLRLVLPLRLSLRLGKTANAITQKKIKLEWKEQQQLKNECCSSSIFSLPEDLPSVEDEPRMLAAAFDVLKTAGLDQAEVLGLRVSLLRL